MFWESSQLGLFLQIGHGVGGEDGEKGSPWLVVTRVELPLAEMKKVLEGLAGGGSVGT